MSQILVTPVLEQIAIAALEGDGLLARSLVQDWLASHPRLETQPPPVTQDPTARALVAALAELMAERSGQNPPPWAAAIGPAPQPTHLLRSALRMSRLRELCEHTAPLPLRRRLIYAPANYLQAV